MRFKTKSSSSQEDQRHWYAVAKQLAVRMASFLATYKSAEALRVARELDAKIEAMLASIA